MTGKFKQFVSPHVHPLSLDSASTPKEMVEKEVELGSGAAVSTDHGFMGACSEIYDLAKKHKLTPILGTEGYLRDDDCPILQKFGIEKQNGKLAHYGKYYHFCVHCMNEKAYSALSVRLSDAYEKRGEKHGSEIKPLFTWEDIEYLGGFDTTATAGCLIGSVSRHLMMGQPEIAEAYYQKMRSCFKPGNFYVEVFPHVCDTYYENGVFLTFQDGTKRKFSQTKKLRVSTDGKTFEVPAMEFSKNFGKLPPPVRLLAYKHYHQWVEIEPLVVVSQETIEGFIENECVDLMGGSDYQKGANAFLLKLAQKYGDKVLVSDDAHYHDKSRHEIQTMKLTSGGGNWKFPNVYARMSSDEAFDVLKSTLGTDRRQFEEWVDNSHEFRDRFKNFTFSDKIQLPTSRYPQDTIAHLRTLIQKHGRMKWHDKRWTDRLKQEIELFKNNGTIDLLPYFFLSEEAIDQYNKRRLLTGSGRGSSGGVAIAYLLGITHVDPIENNLSLDRFITIDRIKSGKLPDIDMDFGDVDVLKHPENGWLAKEFGDRAATIATTTTLRLKSSIKDAVRSRYGHVPQEVERLCAMLPAPPQGITDSAFLWGYTSDDGKEVRGLWDESEELRNFAAAEPEVWGVVKECLGLTRGHSRHASATVISEIPIKEFLPTMLISGVRTTQYTMGGVEARGGLKMDFLGLSTLNDIQDCIELLQKKYGGTVTESKIINGIRVMPHHCVPFEGQYYSVWDLPEKTPVFESICNGDTETVFQLSPQSAVKWLTEFKQPTADGGPAINSKDGIATFTALDRPGPLDAFVEDADGNRYNMLQEYARRARGEAPIGEVKALSSMLKETYGVLVMQEQLQQVYQQLTDCDGIQATEFRTNIAKKKMDKVEAAYSGFMKKASDKIGHIEAKNVWDQLVVFGRYGFCLPVTAEILTKEGVKQIGDVTLADEVGYWSLIDNCIKHEKPTNIYNHGEKEVFEVVLDDGTVVTATEDHMFLYDQEWVSLKAIIEGDQMETLQQSAFKKRKIVSVRSLGKQPVVDLTMPSEENFILKGGLVAHNCRSHARNYGEIAYVCAFLKHFYPLEWWTSVLKNAKKEKIVEVYWKHISHLVLEPDVQLSGPHFQIEGDKIRAPLSFLHGVGEKAHEELVAGRPYKDYKDFADRVFETKAKRAAPVLDETGHPTMEKGMVKMRNGRSAIGTGLVFKLIASGTMDSLFGPMSMDQKIAAYAQYVAEKSAKPTKKPRKAPVVAKIPNEWRDLDKITEYQVAKAILPVYAKSLSERLSVYPDKDIEKRETQYGACYIQNFSKDSEHVKTITECLQSNDIELSPIRLIEGKQIDVFNKNIKIPPGHRFLYGAYVYVVAERRFSFPQKAPPEEQKKALSLTFDSCGQIFDMVKWPDRKTDALNVPSGDLTGSICFLVMSRYRDDRPATIESVCVVRPALKSGEESSE